MAKVAKVEGFNNKEQKILGALSDGQQHDIRELKKLFWKDAEGHCGEVYEKGWGEGEVNSQAQSYVRNSVRRLIRDGWVEGPHMNDNLPRGTYKLTTKGKNWTAKGVAITVSAKEREARREERKAKTIAKKEKAKKQPKVKKAKKTKMKVAPKEKTQKAKKAPKPKKQPKAAAPKKAKAKLVAKKAKSNGAQAKAQAAKAKVSKESAKEKAQAAARRAAGESTPAGNMVVSPTPSTTPSN